MTSSHRFTRVGHSIVRRALASSLALATLAGASPSFASPLALGPEVELTPRAYLGGTHYDWTPSIATNGADALVVWQDSAAGLVAQGHVHYARFSGAGVKLDEEPRAFDLVDAPSAYWDGAEYLVLTPSGGQRLNPATGALQPMFILGGPSDIDPAVAFGGQTILRVWGLSNALSATIYDANGAIQPNAISLPALGTSGSGTWRLAYAAGHFLLAWSEPDTGMVRAVRISSTGVVEDATPITIDPGTALPVPDGGVINAAVSLVDVASSPTGFLVSWNDQRDGTPAIYSSRVSAAGQVADVGGTRILAGQSGAAAWAGSEWWMGTQNESVIGEIAIGADGAIGAPTSLATSGTGSPVVVTTPSTRFIAWPALSKSTTQNVAVEAVSPQGAPASDATLLTTYLVNQGSLHVAASANGYMAMWNELDSDDEYRALALRFTTDGAQLDATPFDVVPPSTYPLDARLAGFGSGYMVAANIGEFGPFSLMTFRDGSNGLDPVGLTTAQLGADDYLVVQSIACTATHCLVAWVDRGSTDVTYAQVLDTVFNPIGPLNVIPSAGPSEAVAVGTTGSSFLVVTGSSLVSIDADGVEGTAVATTLAYPTPLAWGSGRYMMIGLGANQIYRFTDSGHSAEDPETLPTSPFEVANALAWDGQGFLVSTSSANPSAVEVPLGGPSSNLTPFSVFSETGDVLSIIGLASGDLIAAASLEEGSLGGVRAFVRRLALDATDGGVTVDGGTKNADDGGSPIVNDAGLDATSPASPDAGAVFDAGHTDAGALPVDDPSDASGCGCATAGRSDAESAWPPALFALTVFACLARLRGRRGSSRRSRRAP